MNEQFYAKTFNFYGKFSQNKKFYIYNSVRSSLHSHYGYSDRCHGLVSSFCMRWREEKNKNSSTTQWIFVDGLYFEFYNKYHCLNSFFV